jgi:hypothetical protein
VAVQHLSVAVLQVPAAHEHVETFPVHGSVKLPHAPAGHASDVQHVPVLPHVFPPGAALQLFVVPQLTEFPLQSVFVPQSFAPHGSAQAQAFAMHDVPPVQPPQSMLSPHVFFTVPHLPVQIAGGGGVEHFAQFFRIFPHPSETPVPGSQTPGLLHVRGVQPHVLVVVSHAVLVHWLVPQSIVTPQPVIVPHFPLQDAIVGGVQATHWLVFPLQISEEPASALVGHEPQSSVTPQASTRTPHSAPAAAHPGFFDVHRCVWMSQTSADEHAPQFTGWPQSSRVPHALAPRSAQMPGTQPSPATAPSGSKRLCASVASASPASVVPVAPSPLPALPSSPGGWLDPSSPAPIVASLPILPSVSPTLPSLFPTLVPSAPASAPPPEPSPERPPSVPPHAVGAAAADADRMIAATRDHARTAPCVV